NCRLNHGSGFHIRIAFCVYSIFLIKNAFCLFVILRGGKTQCSGKFRTKKSGNKTGRHKYDIVLFQGSSSQFFHLFSCFHSSSACSILSISRLISPSSVSSSSAISRRDFPFSSFLRIRL